MKPLALCFAINNFIKQKAPAMPGLEPGTYQTTDFAANHSATLPLLIMMKDYYIYQTKFEKQQFSKKREKTNFEIEKTCIEAN